MAVADGAGSARYAATAAKCAVRVASSTAAALIDMLGTADQSSFRIVLETSLQQARDTIVDFALDAGEWSRNAVPSSLERAQQQSSVAREYATTLLLVLITAEWYAVAQVGDGAVVIQTIGGELRTVTVAGYGEYINETHFITEPDFLHQAHFAIAQHDQELVGVAMMTDGLQRLALIGHENVPFVPFFAPLFDFARSREASVEELVDFLNSEPVCARTDDDKTLLLAAQVSDDAAGERHIG